MGCASRASYDSTAVISDRIQSRSESSFELLFDSGESRKYETKDSDNPAENHSYELSWIDEESGFAFVHVTEWESERGILVELGEGKEYQVGPQLEFSPDGRWFFDFWEDWTADESRQRAKIWACPERSSCRALVDFPGYAGLAISWPEADQTEKAEISVELSKVSTRSAKPLYSVYESNCVCIADRCKCSAPILLEKQDYTF